MYYDPTEALIRIDQDTKLLAALITVFIQECPKHILSLQEASHIQDLHALADAAHTLKGASATIGFEECRGLAESLEIACRQSGVKSISSFQQLSTQLIDVLQTCSLPLMQWVEKGQ